LGPLSKVLERLKVAGLDTERRHLRCWLGLVPGRPAGRRSAPPGTDAWSSALRGAMRSAQGDLEGARRDLDKAAALLPEESAVRAWRGELHLLSGRTNEALS